MEKIDNTLTVIKFAPQGLGRGRKPHRDGNVEPGLKKRLVYVRSDTGGTERTVRHRGTHNDAIWGCSSAFWTRQTMARQAVRGQEREAEATQRAR